MWFAVLLFTKTMHTKYTLCHSKFLNLCVKIASVNVLALLNLLLICLVTVLCIPQMYDNTSRY